MVVLIHTGGVVEVLDDEIEHRVAGGIAGADGIFIDRAAVCLEVKFFLSKEAK